MEGLLSSRARLADAGTIVALKAFLAHHGALGYRMQLPGVPLRETERLRLVPLLFGLMPRAAFLRAREDQLIKPKIREHLAALALPQDDSLLTSLVKSICDQYWETRKDPTTGRHLKRKYGMADVRANRVMHRSLLSLQSGRCAICGEPFGGEYLETLDHIVPFRLIGDVPDGSNWRILCEVCNSSKSSYVSSLQALPSQNWVYGGKTELPPLDGPTAETRFVLLAQQPHCSVAACRNGPKDARLVLHKRVATGLAIADNFDVVCEKHIT